MDSLEAFKKAQENRAQLSAEARSWGIDEEFISRLVDTFYLRVQNHPELGPVFSDRIQDRWPEHLAKMKVFWGSIALRTSLYEGKPMVVHQGIEAARPEHFQMWLNLWREVLDEIAPSVQARDYLIDRALSMGARLGRGRFGESINLS